MFLLFDGRAKSGVTLDAVVLDEADSEEEAREAGLGCWRNQDAIWYHDGQPRWDLPPAGPNPPDWKKNA